MEGVWYFGETMDVVFFWDDGKNMKGVMWYMGDDVATQQKIKEVGYAVLIGHNIAPSDSGNFFKRKYYYRH